MAFITKEHTQGKIEKYYIVILTVRLGRKQSKVLENTFSIRRPFISSYSRIRLYQFIMGGLPQKVTMVGGNVYHKGDNCDEDDMLIINYMTIIDMLY